MKPVFCMLIPLLLAFSSDAWGQGPINADGPDFQVDRKFTGSLFQKSDTKKVGGSNLPKIKVRVLVKSSDLLTDELFKKLAGNKSAIPKGIFQSTISEPNAETFSQFANSNGVEAMEILRPPVFDEETIVPFNEDARITHNVDDFLSTFANESQNGKTIGFAVFDGGKVRTSHREFRENNDPSRVTVHSTNAEGLSRHATHVAGTICAEGEDPKAKGMATEASVVSFYWDDDIANLDNIAGTTQISNHSYGPNAGWRFNPKYSAWFWWGDTTVSENEDVKFGKYSSENRYLDTVLFRNKSMTTFVAAGNDRNDDPGAGTSHYKIGTNPDTGKLEWQSSDRTRPSDGGTTGRDTIAGLGLCKNAVCIGAIHDITNSSDTIRITDFSGFGPSDDFRVKPDLVANGQDLFSSAASADDAYATLPGTSMACPTAAGIGGLLAEHFEAVHGKKPTSAELKALMIHTAEDSGPQGPDVIFGWGSINTLQAGRVIAGRDEGQITLTKIKQGEAGKFTREFENDGSFPPRVTLVWTDIPGPVNNQGLDDSTSCLVHDLDVTLVSPSGKKHYPYRLDDSNLGGAALNNSPNRRDNVEVIDASAESGTWKLEVIGVRVNRAMNSAGDIVEGSDAEQEFALVTTGLKKN